MFESVLNKKYKKLYFKESRKINRSIIYNLCYALMMIEVVMLILKYFFGITIKNFLIRDYYLVIPIFIILYIFKNIFQIKSNFSDKTLYLFEMIFVSFLFTTLLFSIVWGFGDRFTQYALFVFLNSLVVSILSFDIKFTVSMEIIMHAILTVALYSYSSTYEEAIENCLNIFFSIVCFLFISFPLNKIKEENFNDKMKNLDDQTNLQAINKSLEILALTDGLTKLFNRRAFDEFYKLAWDTCYATQTSLCAIMIDIDFFKKYNDIYSHPEGDQCLKKVSGVLISSLNRNNDKVFRYGGEEFIVILPETTIEGGEVVAERFVEGIYNLKISHKGSDVAPFVTISVGVNCEIPKDISHSSSSGFIDDLDRALYIAKNTGRNKVHVNKDEM